VTAVLKRIVIAVAGVFLATAAFPADQQGVPVLYPKDHSLVGRRVNVVLDPTEIPLFQVTVNTTEYPAVDTSTGVHAYQGLPLEQGQNTITVKVLAPGDKDKRKPVVVASRSLTVYNREGSFSPVPEGFTSVPFHTRERESSCGSCHRLEATSQDMGADKPSDVLCYSCHRDIPTGRHVHGPAALWNCLACHDPELYPAKYAFSSLDPWKVVKSSRSVEPTVFRIPAAELSTAKQALTIRETCDQCHGGMLEKQFKHGPVDAGYCTLCHDPHASPNNAWLRKPGWELCTTCHAGQGRGVHVVAGFAKGSSHPTKGRRDPSRPGKRLSCASCHEPHSAASQYLLAFEVKRRSELCRYCHKK
jgi:predicted CXXCH cytochrome family protein